MTLGYPAGGGGGHLVDFLTGLTEEGESGDSRDEDPWALPVSEMQGRREGPERAPRSSACPQLTAVRNRDLSPTTTGNRVLLMT